MTGVWLVAGWACNGQTGEELTGTWKDVTGTSDADTDDESDADVDTDADTDADSDADVDTDADSDTDTDVDSGATGDTGADCGPAEPLSLWMSPDDTNSTSSAVLVRGRALADLRTGAYVRPWEFLNYYSFDYPAAEPDEVALDVQLTADADLAPGEYRLQIAVTSEERTEPAPMNLALSIDTSCSMTGEPIALASEACLAIAASLRADDVLSVVTWNSTQNTLLAGHSVTGPSDVVLVSVCEGLVSDGSTDLSSGLQTAYDLIAAASTPETVDRVVLISDGGANVGETDAELIGGYASAADDDGIYIVGVGVGTSETYNDALMDTVTDLGRGATLFVDSDEEAWKMLHDRFDEVMDVAVRDLELRLDLPAGFELVKTTAEEVSTQHEEVQPQHLAPNDSAVLHHLIAACDPADVTDDTPITVAVYWKDDQTFLPADLQRTYTFGELLAGSARQLRRGAAIAAYAAAMDLETPESALVALELLAQAEAEYPGDAELAEIRSVLEH
ncbi:MAG: VWA domain-containing protein [Myxococcota bacterium]